MTNCQTHYRHHWDTAGVGPDPIQAMSKRCNTVLPGSAEQIELFAGSLANNGAMDP